MPDDNKGFRTSEPITKTQKDALIEVFIAFDMHNPSMEVVNRVCAIIRDVIWLAKRL